MKERKMICADRFYPSSREMCLSELEKMFHSVNNHKIETGIFGAIVPHAGWVFSGKVSAEVFEAIFSSTGEIDTFIIFGACHCGLARSPIIYDGNRWQTPIGYCKIDQDISMQISDAAQGLQVDNFIHEAEHSIEVNIPILKYRFPDSQIVPIIVPPGNFEELSSVIGSVIKKNKDKKIAVIGSTDLTHYGDDYRFTPKGDGEKGFLWAKNVNDKHLITYIEKLDSKNAVKEANSNKSACGPGAIGATISTCKFLGAEKAVTLRHTHSRDIMKAKYNSESSNSVGYAGIIFT
ncbi:MAG: AmmeMemoRadiSam system protein B [Sedimentisphaeraceae bacterium JB056]